jgi:hypothetical protein
MYWETRNGSSWSTQASAPTSALFPIDSVHLVLDTATWGTGSPAPGFVWYSDLNDPFR